MRKSDVPLGESGGEVVLMPNRKHQTLWVCFLLAIVSLLLPWLSSVYHQQYKLPCPVHIFVSVLMTFVSTWQNRTA